MPANDTLLYHLFTNAGRHVHAKFKHRAHGKQPRGANSSGAFVHHKLQGFPTPLWLLGTVLPSGHLSPGRLNALPGCTELQPRTYCVVCHVLLRDATARCGENHSANPRSTLCTCCHAIFPVTSSHHPHHRRCCPFWCNRNLSPRHWCPPRCQAHPTCHSSKCRGTHGRRAT